MAIKAKNENKKIQHNFIDRWQYSAYRVSHKKQGTQNEDKLMLQVSYVTCFISKNVPEKCMRGQNRNNPIEENRTFSDLQL